MSNANSQPAKAVGVGAGAGMIASMAMAMYAMIASDSSGKGFFTPLYHIASLFISKSDMMTSMQHAMGGHAFYFTLGGAILGALIHMMTGAMYGAVFAVVISRVKLGGMVLIGTGAVYGAIVFVMSAYIGLPIAAAIFSSGDQITHMAKMVGTGTFLVEHIVFGAALGMILAAARGMATTRAPRAVAAARSIDPHISFKGAAVRDIINSEAPTCIRPGDLSAIAATPRPWSPSRRESDADMERAASADKLWCMSEVDIFCDLNETEMGTLVAAAPMKTFDSGALIFTPHQPIETLFILKQGRVRIFRVSEDGRALTTAILEPGTIFGEMVIVGQVMHDSFAEALDPVTACVMNKADVRRLLLGDPRIAARIAETLGKRMSDLEQKLSDTVFKSVPERIASTLLTLSTEAGHRGRGAQVRLTHEQLAALTATSRETTTKVLGEYAEQGVISLGRGRITVLDAARLQRAAGA